MSKDIDVNALFLGPKSENRKFFKEMLEFVMDEHIHWRRDFHPSDRPVVSPQEQRSAPYQDTLVRTEEVLLELSSRLKASSIPAFSPRYLGHMVSDTLMAANLGYLATILYNPNNCSFDASSASTMLELEVGQDLCRLFGFEPTEGWGHITAGGTIANYEALWVARNLKSLVRAIEMTRPDLLQGYDASRRANLPVGEALTLLARVKAEGLLDTVRRQTVQYRGTGPGLGKLIVPESKHYSWTKAADILGLGQDSLVDIPVGDDFRMDIQALRTIVERMVQDGTPILAVVAVVGTTEVGAVDPVHEIVALRQQLEQERGVGFYLHLDAAYGGYARAVFLDEDGRFLESASFQDEWPSSDVYLAFRAMERADSVTVDPHKLGYVPYSAGAIVMRDRRVLDLISHFAAYVFEQDEMGPQMLGSFVMEGSKPGASAAAVWMAHRLLPLNAEGYGRLIGHSIAGAQRLHQAMSQHSQVQVGSTTYRLEPLTSPDLNIVDFACNTLGNTDLTEANHLNRYLYEQCSYRSGPVYLEDFILSKTVLSTTYTSAPLNLVSRLGLDTRQWRRDGGVFVLRSCLMTPFLTSSQSFEEYQAKLFAALAAQLAKYRGSAGAQASCSSETDSRLRLDRTS